MSTVPTTEFCSLNMRLLERNNEVRLALEAASKADEKLKEYRLASEESLKQIKKEWSDYRQDVQTEMKKMKRKVNHSSQESSEAQNMVLENQIIMQEKDDQLKKLKRENDLLTKKLKQFADNVQKQNEQTDIKTQKYISIKEKEIERLKRQLNQAISDQQILKKQISIAKQEKIQSKQTQRQLQNTKLICKQLHNRVNLFRHNFVTQSDLIS